MDYERQQDTEALLSLIRGEIGLRKAHKDITLPRVIGYIHELGAYRRTGLTPEEIKNDIRVHTDLWEEKVKEIESERDYWEREAKKWCNQLAYIRKWLHDNDLDMDDILSKVTE